MYPTQNESHDATLSSPEVEVGTLVLVRAVPPVQQPARVYLARLGEGSRRTMRTALDTLAALLTGHRCDADTLDWSRLRYQQHGGPSGRAPGALPARHGEQAPRRPPRRPPRSLAARADVGGGLPPRGERAGREGDEPPARPGAHP